MNHAEYPFIGHYRTVNGFRMHYLDEGPNNGEPLLMLHGNPSWSYLYRKPVQALREHFRCIVPDHIGMGLSEKPGPGAYEHSLSRRIDDLEQLLEQLAPGPPLTLILHDWGGMIGMGYACRHPGRIKRLVLMNTAAFHLPAHIRMPWQLRLARLPWIGALLIQGCNAFCRGAIEQGVVRGPVSPEVRQAYLAPYDNWQNRLAVLRFVEDIPLHKTDPAYQTVSVIENGLPQFQDLPVLVCWGMQDFVFDDRFLEEWVRKFPAAEVHRFKDAGHYLLEDAAEETVFLIRQFLDRHYR